jgi:glycosyltransferase involved in cell wall biosynthesis
MHASSLVSVVTPVYNGERHLRECIESVLSQTYSNWEYTIVNNCSTDRTLEIATEYAARDSRIRIHNNSAFVRVIPNYNIAFRQISADSEFCKVVAADDYLYPECLEKMVDLALRNDGVAIVGAYALMGPNVAWTGLPPTTAVISGRNVCRTYLLGGEYIFGTATSVLFRSDLVRSKPAFYNESNLHSDTETCLELLQNRDFGFVHEVLTFSRVDDASLTSFSNRFNTFLPWVLYALVTYGASYLTVDELRQRIRHQRLEYFRYLARQLFRHREREFWKFHRTKLAALGFPLRRYQLALGLALLLGDAVRNPRAALKRRLVTRPTKQERVPGTVS